MAEDFGSIWQSFRSQIAARDQRLLHELTSAWKDLDAILESQKDTFPTPEQSDWKYGELASLKTLFEDAAEVLLNAPLLRFRKARPQQRVLEALDDHEAAVNDLIRRLPQTVEVSGRDLAASLRPDARGRLRAALRHWQRRPRGVPLRSIAERHFHRERHRRAKTIGQYLLVLAQSSLAVVDPWEALSEGALGCIEGGSPNPEGLQKQRSRWFKHLAGLRRRAERALDLLGSSVRHSPATFATLLLRSPRSARRPLRTAKTERLLEYKSYWSRQRVAVTEIIELDRKLVDLGRQSAAQIVFTLESVEGEHQDLLSELDSVAEWLRAQPEEETGPFPPPKALLISAEDRARNWLDGVSQAARERLPSTLETSNPRRALPGWRAPWREIWPQRLFIDAIRGTGRETALEGLREAEAEHRGIVREIERSREVVTYSLEAAQSEGEAGKAVAREGIENALSLVLYQRESAGAVSPAAETGLVEGTALAFARSYVAVDQGRLGVLSHFARQGGYRFSRKAAGVGLSSLRRGLLWLWTKLKLLYRWFLIRIGWEREPEPRFEHVKRRGYLGETLRLEHEPRDLPMIYKRLFRLQPVEDPRFLVGREVEMAGLADARAQWEKGRAVSVILAGERGSGKTSLLNCALLRVFHDTPVVQGRFCGRIQSAPEMEAFLRDLLQVPPDEDLRAGLAGQRRVVVIEEMERTFLRHVNGFEGLNTLLSLVSDTSRSTLWILSLNSLAFKFLDASAGLTEHFSHHINAMSVEPEDLKNAILLRHNLSGLRLHFAAPPGRSWIIERGRRWIGLREDRQQMFFDTLYQQSEGVFRSAFELWRLHIDRAEGGVLYLRHPVPPDYGPLAGRLTRQDLFSLQAVLQHGSLTPAEHAIVFGLSEEESRNRLDAIADREILEPDPHSPGWRVCPEAGFFVRRTLDAENLL